MLILHLIIAKSQIDIFYNNSILYIYQTIFLLYNKKRFFLQSNETTFSLHDHFISLFYMFLSIPLILYLTTFSLNNSLQFLLLLFLILFIFFYLLLYSYLASLLFSLFLTFLFMDHKDQRDKAKHDEQKLNLRKLLWP